MYWLVDRRREEARDHDAVERARRDTSRYAEDDRALAGARHQVPEPRLAYAAPFAMNIPSYEWSLRFRNP